MRSVQEIVNCTTPCIAHQPHDARQFHQSSVFVTRIMLRMFTKNHWLVIDGTSQTIVLVGEVDILPGSPIRIKTRAMSGMELSEWTCNLKSPCSGLAFDYAFTLCAPHSMSIFEQEKKAFERPSRAWSEGILCWCTPDYLCCAEYQALLRRCAFYKDAISVGTVAELVLLLKAQSSHIGSLKRGALLLNDSFLTYHSAAHYLIQHVTLTLSCSNAGSKTSKSGLITPI